MLCYDLIHIVKAKLAAKQGRKVTDLTLDRRIASIS